MTTEEEEAAPDDNHESDEKFRTGISLWRRLVVWLVVAAMVATAIAAIHPIS